MNLNLNLINEGTIGTNSKYEKFVQQTCRACNKVVYSKWTR